MIKTVILTPYSPLSSRFPTTKLKRDYMQVIKDFIKDQSGLGQAEGMIVLAVLIGFGVLDILCFLVQVKTANQQTQRWNCSDRLTTCERAIRSSK